MSIEASRAGAPVPRTAVALGITDPVERARAELKAALAAIEEKTNVPKRLSRASTDATATVRSFVRRNPAGGVAAVVGAAAVVGVAVWGIVRLYTR